MRCLKQSIKVMLFSLLIFLLLTLMLAAIIKFTPFPERLGFWGLIAVITLSTVIAGYMEGFVIGRRGLLTGLIMSIVLILLVISLAGCIYGVPLDLSSLRIEYLIPALSGTIASIVGTNNAK